MSDLVGFTVEEMKGVPSFDINDGVKFIGVTDSFSETMTFYVYGDDNEEAFYWNGTKNLACNPIDRMNALCKHLFELMYHKDTIELIGDSIVILDSGSWEDAESTYLSINPFLHTGKDSITREELGL